MKIIRTPAENRIAKEFFQKFTNTTIVSKKLYPKAFSDKSKLPKMKNVGIVASCLSKWKKEGYIDEKPIMKKKTSNKGKEFEIKIIAFRLNLNPFFDYAKEKIKQVRIKEEENWKSKLKNTKNKELKSILIELLKGVREKEFNKIEKKFLEYIFEILETREIACKNDNLFEGITYLLEKIFFYENIAGDSLSLNITKGFFTKNKKYLKKYKDSKEQFEEFWRVAIKHLDKLINKIEIISNFNKGGYIDLNFKEKISRYSSIPFAIPDYECEENRKKSLRRFEIVFYEKRAPTNQELLDTRMLSKKSSNEEEAF